MWTEMWHKGFNIDAIWQGFHFVRDHQKDLKTFWTRQKLSLDIEKQKIIIILPIEMQITMLPGQ